MHAAANRVARVVALVPCVAWLTACGGSSGDGGPPDVDPPPADELVLTTQLAFPDLPAFEAPVLALQAPDDASTWYVVEQDGRVRAFANDASVSTVTTFVDLRARVTSGGEAGLLGMAFHPSYPIDPRVYLSYTTTVDGGLVSRVSAFRTEDGGATLDPQTEQVVLSVPQPASNHNGGHVAFGPNDGFLYIGFGDGGRSGNGQDLTTLLGKVLRIDINGSTGGSPYGVPADNPYSANAPCADGGGTQPCPEIFAYGFRNPWRWSFDRAGGDLWVGDVGQDAREEIDRVVAGGNYGWRCFEGTQPFDADCGPNAGLSLPPVVEYAHAAAHAVTGGYVYRGAAVPGLRGRYVFGDFISGRLWQVPATVAPTLVVTAAQGIETGLGLVSFAEDVAGELYVLDYGGALHGVIEGGADAP